MESHSPVAHFPWPIGTMLYRLEPRATVGVLTVPYSSQDIRAGLESRTNSRTPIGSINFLSGYGTGGYIHISSPTRTVHPPIDRRGYRPHLDIVKLSDKYEHPNRATKNYRTHTVAKRHARKSKLLDCAQYLVTGRESGCRRNDRCNAVRSESRGTLTCTRAVSDVPRSISDPRSVFTGITWEWIGLLLLSGVAWA